MNKTIKYRYWEKEISNVVKLGHLNSDKTKTDKSSISKIDPTFNEEEFLKGAQNFFQMVITVL